MSLMSFFPPFYSHFYCTLQSHLLEPGSKEGQCHPANTGHKLPFPNFPIHRSVGPEAWWHHLVPSNQGAGDALSCLTLLALIHSVDAEKWVGVWCPWLLAVFILLLSFRIEQCIGDRWGATYWSEILQSIKMSLKSPDLANFSKLLFHFCIFLKEKIDYKAQYLIKLIMVNIVSVLLSNVLNEVSCVIWRAMT